MVDEGSSSLRRAIAILEALVATPGDGRGLGVVEVARHVDREKSQVSRTLKLLAEAGFVERDPDTLGYRLGWRMCTLGAAAGDQRLTALAPRTLLALSCAINERAHLSVRSGTDVLTLMSEGPTRVIEAVNWVGRATPLHNTSAGRALLFDYSDHDVRTLLRTARFEGGTRTSPAGIDDFLRRLHQARRRGFAAIDEEFEVGLVAVAAPVRGPRGRVVAALNVSAPKFRLGPRLDHVGTQVAAAAHYLSAQLASEATSEPPLPLDRDLAETGQATHL